MVVDLDRCIGCYGCEIACKQENDVDLGAYWNRVDQMGPYGDFPRISAYWLPHACQHCAEPACVEACPTGASHRADDGVVLVDADSCIGCESCMKACPYGARSIDSRTHVAGKCTLCVDLREAGGRPACVKNCVGQARFVGDLDDPNSDVSQAVANAGEGNVYYLADAGIGPTVAYILHGNICDWHEPDVTEW